MSDSTGPWLPLGSPPSSTSTGTVLSPALSSATSVYTGGGISSPSSSPSRSPAFPVPVPTPLPFGESCTSGKDDAVCTTLGEDERIGEYDGGEAAEISAG